MNLALYGFAAGLAPFADKAPIDQVTLLRDWGCTAVFGGYRDPAFLNAAHAAGMRVYAEFGCFVGERWWTEVPGSRPITDAGLPIEPDEGYCGVNPSVPEVRNRQWRALEKLVTEHEIDGVWLDFIRWPCHWEVLSPRIEHTSFDPSTLTRFAADTGIDLPAGRVTAVARLILTRHRAAWTTWRYEQITSWVARAREIVQSARPGTLLGLFGVPWRRDHHGGAILEVIGQDYAALGPYVDVFSPMVYHRMCGEPPDWVAQVTHEVHASSAKPVWPIVQSIDAPAPLPPEEYAAALDAVLSSPDADGVLVFNLKGALDPARLAITQQRFTGRDRSEEDRRYAD